METKCRHGMVDRVLKKLELLARGLETERDPDALAKANSIIRRIAEINSKEMTMLASVNLHGRYVLHDLVQCPLVPLSLPVEERVVDIKVEGKYLSTRMYAFNLPRQLDYRRGRDSNPRDRITRLTAFKTNAKPHG